MPCSSSVKALGAGHCAKNKYNLVLFPLGYNLDWGTRLIYSDMHTHLQITLKMIQEQRQGRWEGQKCLGVSARVHQS